MPRQVDGHPDFNDTIAAQHSRWFECGYFTWKKASASVSTVAVQLYTTHRFVAYHPHGPWANMVASSS
jgi:hypothetical protein